MTNTPKGPNAEGPNAEGADESSVVPDGHDSGTDTTCVVAGQTLFVGGSVSRTVGGDTPVSSGDDLNLYGGYME